MFYARIAQRSDREPNFDERRQFKDQMDERVFKYLREHPEIEQKVALQRVPLLAPGERGQPRGEVRVLLDEPVEQTIDPALMGALAKAAVAGDVRDKAKEAWVYPLGWVLYFDDKGVVSMLRRPQSGFLVSE